MEINIAGAGAGKTTKMSDKIILLRNQIDAEKKIFCVAFTNSAVDCIRRKLCEHYVQIPENIIVSTIHSFLYREIIKPYYHLLYGKKYEKISIAELPQDAKYKKQGVYETHDYKKNNIRENLAEELEPLLFENHPTKDAQTVKKVAYYYAGKMIEKYRSTREKKDAMTLLSNWEKIDSRRYGIIINLFEDESPIKQEDKIFVKSIDYIKGMEGEKCLFILTNDLAAHLFNNNTETNKTKNKLYVALTRSLNELSIYILKEVEDKYTKKRIQDFFERYL